MSQIKLLSEEIINKIAAGEVIERPASVVKELIENSLDAGATKVTVEIKDYGKELIKVSDNGSGMSTEDAEKSILRHATSKITSAEDLFSINTLGFRGEALASIAAVSKLTITTKQQNQLGGYRITVEGGLITKSSLSASETGTMVEVQDLFFNTPARKKFLKTDAVELKHIINVITQYALLHYSFYFKLIHDGKAMINSPAAPDMKSNIASLYGLKTAKELIAVNYQDENISIKGLVIKPYFARNDKNWQSVFVNHRWIKNEDLTNAVYEAYRSILFINKHPIFVLNLQLDPQRIDVNIHPTKSDIKIEQTELVCSVITKAVREALARENLLPEVDLNMLNLTFSLPPYKKVSLPPKYSFDQSQQMVLREAVNSSAYVAPIESASMQQEFIIPSSGYLKELQTHSTLPPLKLLGQIHKTFFAAETIDGMFFIDQHAAHERVLYEQFMEQYLDNQVVVQNLLQPVIFDVVVSEVEVVKENLESLNRLGLELSEFGDTSFVIKTIPAIFDKLPAKEMVQEIIQQWGKRGLDTVKEEIITRMACRSAVMAGEELTILEMDSILKELSATRLPFTCPHGRPIMIQVSVDELEKKFRRK